MENFNIVWHYKDLLLKGLGYTVFVSVAAILIALCVGMLLSVMRMGGSVVGVFRVDMLECCQPRHLLS